MRLAYLLVGAILLALAGPGAVHAETPKDAAPKEPAYKYASELLCEDSGLLSVLKRTSAVVSRQKTPPPTQLGLRRRMREDEAAFKALLRSRGFYASTTTMELDTDPKPPKVTIEVDTGPLYHFASFVVENLPPEAEDIGAEAFLKRLAVAPGDPATSSAVVDAGATVLAELGRRSYPLATVAKRDVIVDHDTKTMEVTLKIAPGPFARIGEIRVEGLGRTNVEFINDRLEVWRGDPWDPVALEASRRALMDTGIFSAVRFVPDAKPHENGELDLTLHLNERLPRRFTAGASFSSANGIGIRSDWEHRNFSGGGEHLRIQARAATIASNVTVSYREPDWPERDRDFVVEGGIATNNTDAFDRRAVHLSAGFDRRLSNRLSLQYGLSFEESRLTEDGQTDQFSLLGVPTALRYDGANDLLDPTRGIRASIAATPYLDLRRENRDMIVARASGAIYRPVFGSKRLVAAGRAGLGAIWGPNVDRIPGDKRFYAGGAETVRGYAFQEAGDLEDDGDPRGGRSIYHVGAELRWKITPTIGIVPFVEGANVSNRTVPQLGEPLLWGAGLGLRYYSAIGPLRVDVAVPLDNREDSSGEKIDDPFQLYISLGQAF